VRRDDIMYVVRLPIQIKLLNFFESEVGVKDWSKRITVE
jgi:hypothetical protein